MHQQAEGRAAASGAAAVVPAAADGELDTVERRVVAAPAGGKPRGTEQNVSREPSHIVHPPSALSQEGKIVVAARAY